MTVRAYDATNIEEPNIPLDAQMVLYYMDGRYAWTPEQIAKRSQAIKVSITCTTGDPSADVCDCESGCQTPQGAANYAHARYARGAVPCIYCNLNTWPTVTPLVLDTPVDWWIADWTGSVDHLLPGTVGTQWASLPGYDVSTFIDDWPRGDSMSRVAYDAISGGTWTIKTDGAVFTADGAPYLGGLNQHPEWHAGVAGDLAIGIAPWTNGYVIVTFDTTDTTGDPFRYYRFPGDASRVMPTGPQGPPGAGGPQGLAGPKGDPGPPGSLSQTQVDALHAAGQALSGL